MRAGLSPKKRFGLIMQCAMADLEGAEVRMKMRVSKSNDEMLMYTIGLSYDDSKADVLLPSTGYL